MTYTGEPEYDSLDNYKCYSYCLGNANNNTSDDINNNTSDDINNNNDNAGVVVTVKAEVPGYEVYFNNHYTKDYAPSSITVQGTVKDETGKVLPGAIISLPDLGRSTTADSSGWYKLSVETEGTKPFDLSPYDIVLKQQVVSASVALTAAPQVMPVPGTASLKVSAVDQNGSPLKDGSITLEIADADKLGFVSLEKANASLDQNGEFTTNINIREITANDYIFLKDIPLSLTIRVKVQTGDLSLTLAQKEFTFPFNMALIKGLTVGPDMKPRFESDIPQLVVNRNFVISGQIRDNSSSGEFFILVPLGDPKLSKFDKQLKWSDAAVLPLIYPFEQQLEPGKTIDLGSIDLLSPQEHEERVKSLMADFIQVMPLTGKARGDALTELNNVSFIYNCTASVPFYKDNISSGGTIQIPGDAKTYWGNNIIDSIDSKCDPAYAIMLHELGHFLHHTIVETNYYLHVCYNSYVGVEHSTWTPPTPHGAVGLVAGDTQKLFTSFAENTADFFASLAFSFWENKEPEMKKSIYFDKSYLSEFDDEAKAMAAVGTYPGYCVEGVQTRFLRAFYGSQCSTSPVPVFTDYLATMYQYKDNPENKECWILRVPARTMQQWVFAKSNHPSAVGVSGGGDVYNTASRYRLFADIDPVPTIAPAQGSKSPEVLIGTNLVTFEHFPVAEIPFGTEVEVKKGTVNIDLSTRQEQRTLYLNEGTVITIQSQSLAEVKQGYVGLEGKVTMKTPVASVTPTGTVVMVNVAADGATTVKTLEGQAEVESSGSILSLSAGQQMQVSKDGTAGEISSLDLAAVRQELLPAGESPFESEPLTGMGSIDALGNIVCYALMMLPYIFIALVILLIVLLYQRIGALVLIPVLIIALGGGAYYFMSNRGALDIPAVSIIQEQNVIEQIKSKAMEILNNKESADQNQANNAGNQLPTDTINQNADKNLDKGYADNQSSTTDTTVSYTLDSSMAINTVGQFLNSFKEQRIQDARNMASDNFIIRQGEDFFYDSGNPVFLELEVTRAEPEGEYFWVYVNETWDSGMAQVRYKVINSELGIQVDDREYI